MNWQNITQGFNRLLRLNSSELDQPKRLFVTILQSGYAITRDLLHGQIQLHAMSLVYTTLLSIVPLLALSVSVLKSFGVHNQLEPILQNFLEPMGPKGLELSAKIISFVENMNVAVLGSVGIGLLFYTAISLIQKVEDSFNYIWCVKHRRTLAQQVSHYLSVLMVGPVLLVSLVGVVASTMNTSWMKYLLSFDTFGFAAWFSTYILPTLIVTAVITSVYMFVPNTKVRLQTAAIGAFFAAILWKTGGSIFSFFVVSSTKYDAIYSGFAIAMMLMIWLFLSWLILLVGTNLSFYWQNPSSVLKPRNQNVPDGLSKRQLGMKIMVLIGQQYQQGKPGCTLEMLVEQLATSASNLIPLLEIFEQRGMLIKANTDQENYLPARDIGAIQLQDIIGAIDGKISLNPEQSSVDDLFLKLEQQRSQILDNQSLRDFIINIDAK
ncbi:MAG: YihY/virulence factor BrkB family protein [Pseudomonadales bacterium]|nr:YihY/virulence factor BrkB family protein [Pseudomonadales bacterium]